MPAQQQERKIESVDLQGVIDDIGPVRFLRAEWRNPNTHAILLRYSLNGEEQGLGLCMDIDKKAILDDVGIPDVDKIMHERSSQMWDAIMVKARPFLVTHQGLRMIVSEKLFEAMVETTARKDVPLHEGVYEALEAYVRKNAVKKSRRKLTRE